MPTRMGGLGESERKSRRRWLSGADETRVYYSDADSCPEDLQSTTRCTRTHGMPPNTRARKQRRECDDVATASEAISGLPLDIVVTHVLSANMLHDTADLANLRMVSHAMRNAVAETGREIMELDAPKAARLACLGTLQGMRRRSPLVDGDEVCAFAASGGHLEVLKCLRMMDCPWSEGTCCNVALRGHLELLQWAHDNSCPWDKYTCIRAAEKGDFEILKWLRAKGCPWNEKTCMAAASLGNIEILDWAASNGCSHDQ